MRLNTDIMLQMTVIADEDYPDVYYQCYIECASAPPIKFVSAGIKLDSFYLWEVPFIIVKAESLPDTAMPLGWDIFLAEVEDWQELFDTNKRAGVVGNTAAIELTELSEINLNEMYEKHNLHLYCIHIGDSNAF